MATIKYKDENGYWQDIVIGGGTSEESVYNVYAYETLTEEQKAANKATYDAYAMSKSIISYINIIEDTEPVAILTDSFVYVPDELVMVQGNHFYSANDEVYHYNIAVHVFPDGNAQVAHSSEALTPTTSKVEEMIAASSGSGGGGSNRIDLQLSLTSGNPVSNTVITSNIGIRIMEEADINTTDGWQLVFNTLMSQVENHAVIPVTCMLNGQTAFVYSGCTLGPNESMTSLIAICNGKTYVIPRDTEAMEYPFVFTNDPSKKTDNQLRGWIKNDVWNEAVLEIDGIRYVTNGLTQETGYASFKVVVGNELRTYFVYTANVGDIEAGTLTLVNTEYIGSGGGGSDVNIFPSEYSDEFNDDFTN